MVASNLYEEGYMLRLWRFRLLLVRWVMLPVVIALCSLYRLLCSGRWL